MTALDDIAAERRVFDDPRPFQASMAAEQWLERGGYSVGRRQRGEPRGILRGDWDIQKWRNLRKPERLALHGVMTGDGLNGPVTVVLFGPDAKAELDRLDRLAAAQGGGDA